MPQGGPKVVQSVVEPVPKPKEKKKDKKERERLEKERQKELEREREREAGLERQKKREKKGLQHLMNRHAERAMNVTRQVELDASHHVLTLPRDRLYSTTPAFPDKRHLRLPL